ncbi:hypothetical protein [Polaromonas sp. DSR2-3-2]|uniref:hypothetical protein n=1 Tax=unclassified Polaromonas TaxID=2638319 RepID=UPI003CEB5CF4
MALTAMTQDANAEPTEKSRAGKLIEMHRHISDGYSCDFQLKHVAEKIDLTAAVRD